MSKTCTNCGKPFEKGSSQTSLTYKFRSPTGYKCTSDFVGCSRCGPKALRAGASQINAWADVMEGKKKPPLSLVKIHIRDRHQVPGRGTILTTLPGPKIGEYVWSGNETWEVTGIESGGRGVVGLLVKAWKPTEEEWEKLGRTLGDKRLKWYREHSPGCVDALYLLHLWGEKWPELEDNKDEHTEHCCIEHGCKYGQEDDECTVFTGIKVQSGLCEGCMEKTR